MRSTVVKSDRAIRRGCSCAMAEAALQRPREIMGKLKLTVNEEKTRICKVPEGEFDFLRYTSRHDRFFSLIERPESVEWECGAVALG